MLEALVFMGLGCLIRAGVELAKGKKDEAAKSFKDAMMLLTIAAALALMLYRFAPQLGTSNGL